MTMTLIYRLIIALVMLFTIVCLYSEKSIRNQANNVLVLIPLLLRLLMIK